MLQLLIHCFHSVGGFSKLLSKTKSLVKKFNKSLKATEKLFSVCMIECILEVKIPLTAVLEELELGLALSEWKNLEF